MSSREFKLPKASVDEPPALELKPLPSHLRYAYLGEVSTLPVLISALLTEEQEEQLLISRVLVIRFACTKSC